MQGAEFINDLRCNYLIVPYAGEENDFALRMLTENAAEGFLPMELRRLDGQTYLYYNISGMQNMEIIYAEKTIDRDAFRNFMWQLHDAIEQSRELFLPGDGICLEPAMLFWDLGKQNWEFVYMPGRDGKEITDIQKEREQLAEFLVMRIDYEDKELADTVYRFYEEICAGRMYPDSFLEEENEKRKEERQEDGYENTDAGLLPENREEGTAVKDFESVPETEEVSEERGPGKFLFLLWCAAVTAIFILGRTMQGIILPGGAVIVFFTALLLYLQIKRRRGKIQTDPDPEKTDMVYMEEDIPYKTESIKENETASEDKTVYMDICREQEKKLYGTGKFRQQKIFLNELPCTVGKDKTLVDHIVSDSSISRMHARFFAEGEYLWMQDLNSTNGTYHNGLRLKPNEKVMLEAEDEVGFGRAQFIFR